MYKIFFLRLLFSLKNFSMLFSNFSPLNSFPIETTIKAKAKLLCSSRNLNKNSSSCMVPETTKKPMMNFCVASLKCSFLI